MATLAELQSFRAALASARYSGVLTVERNGKKLTYKSDADLAAAIAAVDRDIAAAIATPIRTVRVATSKGL